jgi:nucleotide-binding universal stress UspA family protein
MNTQSTVLCPIDFSDAGRGALRYARAIVQHFGGRLVILTVEDPLLTEAIHLGTGIAWDPEDTRKQIADFSATVFGGRLPKGVDIALQVSVGKPANEILRTAQRERCDLIVMSTHGLTGARKFFFGSTTERVLRETTVPVLATPATDYGPDDLDQARRIVGRILVPVDLTSASSRQVLIASGLAQALDVPLILTYVIEPVRSPLAAKLPLHSVELERRARAEQVLRELMATVPAQLHPEGLVVYGDPAEEITKVAADRQAGLILVGLHGSPMLGPRMGSVTYRVLCLTPGPVLAVPPAPVLPACQVG